MVTYASIALDRINDLGIDCTYRQLDYWCRQGLLGDRFAIRTPGWRREFDTGDLEVLHALAGVRSVANNTTFDLSSIADTVRSRPVSRDGEILVVDVDGQARRFDHWCAEGGPCIVIPLRSFADVPPVGDRSPADGPHPSHGGETAGVASPPAPANHAAPAP